MNIPVRLVNMILRGHPDKFKTILQEELRERASKLMEEAYRLESLKILETIETDKKQEIKENIKPETAPVTPKFIPDST